MFALILMKKQNQMNQPDLGKQISEIRNQKGVTQKQLSESCNIDIRTVQRIESGEVVPRYSTLKLIADFLEIDYQMLNGGNNVQPNVSKDLLLVSFLAGILNIINWLFYVSIIPVKTGNFNLHLVFSTIHLLTTVFFYMGFFILGKNYMSLILQIVSVVIFILVPVIVITEIAAASINMSFMSYLIKLVAALLGINGIVFGAGLILIKGKFPVLYKVGGILQILINPLFIIPLTLLNRIGLYLAVPSLILFVMILLFEYRSSGTGVHKNEPVVESI